MVIALAIVNLKLEIFRGWLKLSVRSVVKHSMNPLNSWMMIHTHPRDIIDR